MLLSPISSFSFPLFKLYLSEQRNLRFASVSNLLSQLNAASFCSSFNDGVCVQVMDKDPRKAATPVKGPTANAGTRGAMNRIQSRRDRKLALQQDVLEILCQPHQFVGFGCFL